MEGYYQTTNSNGYALAGQPLPQGNHTLNGQMNGGHNYNHTNGGSTNHSSALQFQDEPMETSMSRSSAKQQAIEDLRKELRSHAEDKPKPYKEDIPKTPIKDVPTENKYITVAIRGQGTKTTAIQIKRTAKLDEFITEANSASGLGSKGNSYIVFNGKELSRETGKTVEQAGLKDGCIVEVCVRTIGDITVAIRGQGTKTTAIQIKRTAKLDEFITEANSASGLGSKGNSYIVFNGKELSRGTGKTVEQAGLKDGCIVEVCVRTVGG